MSYPLTKENLRLFLTVPGEFMFYVYNEHLAYYATTNTLY